MHYILIACLFLAVNHPAEAEQFVAFKKAGRFGGTGLRVASMKHADAGRVLLFANAGDVYEVKAVDVDWELSRRLTEKAISEKAAEDLARVRQTRRGKLGRNELSMVEASRRYGIDHPGMLIVAEVRTPEKLAEEQTESAAADKPKSNSEVAAIERLLAGYKAEKNKLDNELKLLRHSADPSVDAADRQARIQTAEKGLRDAERAIEQQETYLKKARSTEDEPAAATSP